MFTILFLGLTSTRRLGKTSQNFHRRIFMLFFSSVLCIDGFICDVSLSIFVNIQGPVVQSVVSLMSSLGVKMLTVLINTISNLQVFC